MTSFWLDVRAFAEGASARAGKRLLAEFGRSVPSVKADGTLVTDADRAANEMLLDSIRKRFPDHAALTEEGNTTAPGAEWCWIVDPLDGTTNFARGVPVWAISLGLLHRGVPVFGHVRVPPLGESFDGVFPEGSGEGGPAEARLNGRRIETSRAEPDRHRFFTICSRSTALLLRPFPCKIRMLGSAAHNYLLTASGAALGGVEETPKIWDLAGVWPIVKAAGGEWAHLAAPPFPLVAGSDYARRSFPSLAVARADLLPVFLPLVRAARESGGDPIF